MGFKSCHPFLQFLVVRGQNHQKFLIVFACDHKFVCFAYVPDISIWSVFTHLAVLVILCVMSVITFQMSLCPCITWVLRSLNHVNIQSGMVGTSQPAIWCAIAPLRSGSMFGSQCSVALSPVVYWNALSFKAQPWCCSYP